MRRGAFRDKMDGLSPWYRLEERIGPVHPKPGRGHQPYSLGAMLRVHPVQLFYDLSDPGMEDLLYEVEPVRHFAGLQRSGAQPDETKILCFRHQWEKRGLGEKRFEKVNLHLASHGQQLKTGTMGEREHQHHGASAKHRKGEPDPEMRHTKKGNQWYFGMKAHIGVDADSGLARSVQTTPAKVSDLRAAHVLSHRGREQVWGDAGYHGTSKREES